MIKTKKVQYGEIYDALKDFSDGKFEQYKSYSYVAGFYESKLAQLVADLPAHKQREFLQSLKGA